MDWIDQLDEEGWNVVIDELVWHLREGRLPLSINKRLRPDSGIEFKFTNSPASFLTVQKQMLEDHWQEARDIISRFPQLREVQIGKSS